MKLCRLINSHLATKLLPRLLLPPLILNPTSLDAVVIAVAAAVLVISLSVCSSCGSQLATSCATASYGGLLLPITRTFLGHVSPNTVSLNQTELTLPLFFRVILPAHLPGLFPDIITAMANTLIHVSIPLIGTNSSPLMDTILSESKRGSELSSHCRAPRVISSCSPLDSMQRALYIS